MLGQYLITQGKLIRLSFVMTCCKKHLCIQHDFRTYQAFLETFDKCYCTVSWHHLQDASFCLSATTITRHVRMHWRHTQCSSFLSFAFGFWHSISSPGSQYHAVFAEGTRTFTNSTCCLFATSFWLATFAVRFLAIGVPWGPICFLIVQERSRWGSRRCWWYILAR